MLRKLDAYWRAANYLAAGQLYLLDNPLLREPLRPEHLKRTLVGHWGTVPGQNFIYTHLNRVITRHELNMIYVSGPGHGGNAVVAQTYLEGTYSEFYPNVSQDGEGMRRLFRQFSFPGGIGSHCAPETPGSINEGGELGYSLAHAFGAVMDNPTLIAACVVGDGGGGDRPAGHCLAFQQVPQPPSPTGRCSPSSTSTATRFPPPPCSPASHQRRWRTSSRAAAGPPALWRGRARPDAPEDGRGPGLGGAGDSAHSAGAREFGETARPRWPMLVFRSPKGWTCPKEVDGAPTEGTFRAHQLPVAVDAAHPEHLEVLERWLRSYRPEELFDAEGARCLPFGPWPPRGAPHGRQPPRQRRHASAGSAHPSFTRYAVEVPAPGEAVAEDMAELGKYVRDVLKLNQKARNFRIFAPDEALSNKLTAAFEASDRRWNAELRSTDEGLSADGRIMDSMLSEHMCQGWLEGYLLTGRHGFLNSYEAFIRIVDSMVSQHAKWLKVARQLPWRQDIASMNYVLSSNVWQQDHNGFTHQDPGFLDHVANKKADVVRLYLPLTPTACSPSLTTVSKPELRQCDGGLQAPPAPVAHHGRGHQALYPRHRHLAVGLQ